MGDVEIRKGALPAGWMGTDPRPWLVLKANVFRVSATYALGHSYQVRENVLVTSHLILPLDFCNAALYIVATSFGIAVRERRAQFEPHRFQALLELAASVGKAFWTVP